MNLNYFLQQLKTPEWLYEEMIGTLHLGSIPTRACIFGPYKKHKFSFRLIILTVQNDQIVWIYSRKVMEEEAEKLVKREMRKKGYFLRLFQGGAKIREKFNSICQKIERTNVRKSSDFRLKNLYTRFVNIYLNLWSWAVCTEFFSFYGEGIVLPYFQERYGPEGSKIFIALSTTLKKSFAKEEAEDLFKIGSLLQTKAAKSIINAKLQEHARKFFWITNNYRNTPRLKPNYFLREIRNKIKEGFDFKKALREQEAYFPKIKKNKNYI